MLFHVFSPIYLQNIEIIFLVIVGHLCIYTDFTINNIHNHKSNSFFFDQNDYIIKYEIKQKLKRARKINSGNIQVKTNNKLK